LDEALFGETHGSYLIAYKPEHETAIEKLLEEARTTLKFIPLGKTTASKTLDIAPGISVDIPTLKSQWQGTLS